MAISFNSIPINLRTPGSYIEYDASRAVQGLVALPKRVLLIGSMDSATGSSAVNTLQQIRSGDDGALLFGLGTQLSHMVERYKVANNLTETWAIGLDDDGSGVTSTWTLTFGGTATADGTVYLWLGGREVRVAVLSGDAAAAVAIAADVAIDADATLPFTSSVATVVTTLVSNHASEFSSNIDVRANYQDRQELPAGITLAIVQTVAGSNNPTVSTIITGLPTEELYTSFITGWRDDTNMDALEAEALSRWGPLVQLDGEVIASVSGNFATMSAYGQARNSQFSSVIGSTESPTPDYEWAAVYGGVEAFEPDPGRPRQTLALPGLLPAARDDRLTQADQNLLLFDGVATHSVDSIGAISIQRAITTYQTNSVGTPDPTFLDITTMRTLAALRFTTNARITLRYPRHKLASDGTIIPPGQAIVTPSVIRAELIALYGQWADQGWVEGGSIDQFKDELLVERNSTDVNRIDAIIPPDLINQFRVFAAQIQFLL